MAFAGPGDPTGKGRGFSFVKDTRKVSLLQKLLADRGTLAVSALVVWHSRARLSAVKAAQHFARAQYSAVSPLTCAGPLLCFYFVSCQAEAHVAQYSFTAS